MITRTANRTDAAAEFKTHERIERNGVLTDGIGLALAKIERRRPLSAIARKAFLQLPHRRCIVSKHTELMRAGDRPNESIFLERGMLGRSKFDDAGARQIVSLHVPGDMVDLQSLMFEVADHGISAETDSVVLYILHREILALTDCFPEIRRALWFDTLVDAALYREWTLNVGRRNAMTRVAHLLMEIGYRLEEAGMGRRDAFSFRMSQVGLADATGLTPVHVSRVLSRLKTEGILRWHSSGEVEIPDWDNAAKVVGFEPDYLHVEGPRG